MGLDHDYIRGHTPLEEEEKEGLILSSISSKADLDEFEQQNIEEAIEWVMGRKLTPEKIFTEFFIRKLHRKMYGHVWAWAGHYRKTEKNLGIPAWQVSMAIRKLCDDALFWVEHKNYEPEELAIRFKHRIVCVHGFSNGNGRHSRLMADIIVNKIYGLAMFTWGANRIIDHHQLRKEYLHALVDADHGHFDGLIRFARS